MVSIDNTFPVLDNDDFFQDSWDDFIMENAKKSKSAVAKRTTATSFDNNKEEKGTISRRDDEHAVVNDRRARSSSRGRRVRRESSPSGGENMTRSSSSNILTERRSKFLNSEEVRSKRRIRSRSTEPLASRYNAGRTYRSKSVPKTRTEFVDPRHGNRHHHTHNDSRSTTSSKSVASLSNDSQLPAASKRRPRSRSSTRRRQIEAQEYQNQRRARSQLRSSQIRISSGKIFDKGCDPSAYDEIFPQQRLKPPKHARALKVGSSKAITTVGGRSKPKERSSSYLSREDQKRLYGTESASDARRSTVKSALDKFFNSNDIDFDNDNDNDLDDDGEAGSHDPFWTKSPRTSCFSVASAPQPKRAMTYPTRTQRNSIGRRTDGNRSAASARAASTDRRESDSSIPSTVRRESDHSVASAPAASTGRRNSDRKRVSVERANWTAHRSNSGRSLGRPTRRRSISEPPSTGIGESDHSAVSAPAALTGRRDSDRQRLSVERTNWTTHRSDSGRSLGPSNSRRSLS
mmetsp:Transcript_26890/g.59023  ORF Transcript_26890/g.59023 Transcript_26890/m.59023 type:complete len:518 (-) Transcript_26890:1486-3039(-)